MASSSASDDDVISNSGSTHSFLQLHPQVNTQQKFVLFWAEGSEVFSQQTFVGHFLYQFLNC